MVTPSRTSPLRILKEVWGYHSFRPHQEEVIQEVLQAHDVVAVLATGAGKSITYQLPALMQPGLCLVISPLISLMIDQVNQLNQLNIKAACIYSGMPQREIDILLDNAIQGAVKLLYVSPERVQTELFRERCRQMELSFLAVDEAHCISEWGHDFRPSYLQLYNVRELHPDIPVLAVTATATPTVQHDIVEQLKLRKPRLIRSTFKRDQLQLVVRQTEEREKKLVEVLHKSSGPAIVYANTRRQTEQIAKILMQNGIVAGFYHGGLDSEQRIKIQNRWISNRQRVVVATNAFGMGINKADVRLVLHAYPPTSMEAYYQEVGRAGRDGGRSYGVLLFNDADDRRIQKLIEDQFPPREFIQRIYQALANYFKIAIGSSHLHAYDFDMEHFARQYDFLLPQTYAAIKRLEDEGLLNLIDRFQNPSRLRFIVGKKDLYAFEIANARLEPLLKAILRLYGGSTFSEFQSISESRLGNATRQSVQDIRKQLHTLHDREIVVYDPRKDNPQLIFTQPRQDVNQLSISAKSLQKRKQHHLDRWQQVMDYARQEKRCRMAWIQDYFGESTADPCGICDVCLPEKRQKSKEDQAKKAILETLYQNTLSLESMADRLPDIDQQILIHAIQSLLEEGRIQYDGTGKLSPK